MACPIRRLRNQLQEPICPHPRKFVAQVERKRTMFVEDELETRGHIEQLLQEKHRFLDVGFPAPTAAIAQFARSSFWLSGSGGRVLDIVYPSKVVARATAFH